MKNKQPKEKIKGSARRRAFFRGRQQNTSIFFLFWTVFSLFSLIVVLLFGFLQQTIFVQSYKSEASQDIIEKGVKIESALRMGPPEAFGPNNYNGYVRFLGLTYDVDIIIMDGSGELVLPRDPNLDPNSSEYKEYYYRADELKTLQEKLGDKESRSAVYEEDSEYVYGAEVVLYGNTFSYLRVAKSLHLMESTLSRMRLRTGLLAVFVFILSFATSCALSGWFVNPITELTKKARMLAEGDFDVDFHGNDYGRELLELAESLNFARDELSKTDRMQKELIANVSHDFKTPLTMIKGYASMIIEISGDNPEKRNKHAQIIVDEADRLTSLVGDVLDLSKIRSGIAQLEMERFDVGDYLREVLDRFAYLESTQGYVFEVEIEDGLYARADKLKIGQVLYNLIGNAVNYTGEDKRVLVALKREDGCFRFSVTDTGAGIKSEELGGIWDRYYRSTENHKRPVQGTGLGLSIVKTILERHGFYYGVNSELGKGSTFYVLFPIAE